MKIEEIKQALNVSAGTAYKWKKYLTENGIKVKVENFEELDKWIRKEHKLEGFAEDFKRREAEAAAAATETAIALSEPAIATAHQQGMGNAIASSPESSSPSAANPDITIDPEPEGDYNTRLIRSGQERATAEMIAEMAIAAELRKRPELLPEDLQQQIKKAEAQYLPKKRSPAAVVSLAEQLKEKMLAAVTPV